MLNLLEKYSDQEIMQMIRNIESKQLCLMMIVFTESDKKRIFSLISDKAKELLTKDIAKLSEAIAKVEIN